MVVKRKETVTKTVVIKGEKPNNSSPKKKRKPKQQTQKKDENMSKILVENFVSLQKVMTNFAIKFDSLSNQMSKLLELFEISAKTMSEKGYAIGEDKKILEKLDSLLEHNKVIAKGIALLHEKDLPEEPMPPQQIPMQRPMPHLNMPPAKQETRFSQPPQTESSKPRLA